ncbi:hypothetical protein HNQ79_003877 [Streptomyces candidus]|uniref:Uncharacterized protein n=1 Tax=Streptomyces candidus TaxID=67283 RepID=A0A7X0HGU4_9ACTN|nr:hypothetical protein [Streptomyces candidus]
MGRSGHRQVMFHVKRGLKNGMRAAGNLDRS